MEWLSWFLDMVKSHQIVVLIMICALVYASYRARFVFKRIFGDEDYPTTDWVIVSLILFACVLSSILLASAFVITLST